MTIVFIYCQATMTYSNGSKYVGQWFNSNKHGQGTFTTNEGVIYAGEWENDNLNGEATITSPEGNTVKGFFKDGKFIKEIKDL